MTGIILNPGSGPVAGADEALALANMQAFVVDVEAAHGVRYEIQRNAAADEGDGRFAFRLVAEGETHDVDMPGIPLEQVRWVDGPDQNIWDFPRLYVDGSSWVWKYAVRVCRDDDEK